MLVLTASLAPVRAETFTERANNDNVDTVTTGDPAMAKAVAAARQTLPGFFALASHPTPGTSRFAVKVGLGPKGNQEFFWIAPFSVSGDQLTGRLANEPERVEGYTKGQTITVPVAEVTDWMYFEGQRMKGNYSACALLTHEPPEARAEFARTYGKDCSEP
jgi:uncharacterized protein YegJ (DUF2314 family)